MTTRKNHPKKYSTTSEGWASIYQAIFDVYALFKPPPRLTVSEWAERERYLSPESSSEPGKWHNARNPILVEPMDCLSPFSEYHTVVCKFSSQTGKTEILNNFCGYIIDQDPGPTLVLQPNVKPMAIAWSKDRLAPMIRDTPALTHKVSDAKARDSGNTVEHKSFPGGHITIAGANSPAGLASRPIRYVAADEINRYPPSAGTEGSPLKLARKRQVSFWNRKTLLISSPTVPEYGISAEYELSDKRRYYVPCPECGEYQTLVWQNVTWPTGRPQDAGYSCVHCGVVIASSHKPAMLAKGEWRKDAPHVVGIAGFWINQLYSPFLSWGETATEFLDAGDDPQKLKTFFNTALAEDWVEKGDAPDQELVKGCATAYPMRTTPRGVQVVVCTVDVQKDRLVYVVRGWGAHLESWLIDAGELFGDTATQVPWDQLEAMYDEPFGNHFIRIMLIDSGYRTDRVYAFCLAHRGRALPTKGHDQQEKPVKMSKVEVNHRGKISKQSLNLWHIDSSFMKSWVHARVKRDPSAPGGWHLPRDITDDYCAQIVAEGQVQKENGKMVWVQHGYDNHYLDCEALQTASIYVLGLKALKPLAEDDVEEVQPEPIPEAQPKPAAQPPDPIAQAPVRRRMRSSGVSL